jgi:Coenzyme PQQ synthesis protein D (PqqD)
MIHEGREIFLVCQDTNLRAIVNQDGAAILDIKSGRITTLNTSGGYVWQALGNGEEIEAIAEGLARETGQDVEAVRRDVVDFVEDLKKQHLLPG